MKSSITSILEILNKAETLTSIGFSAGYCFDEEKADIYFDELMENSIQSSPIFSGIMLIEKSEDESIYTIVDGLQRLTSLSLLLAALCESAKNTTAKNEDARHKVFTRYLINDADVKLQLMNKEQEIYKKIVFSLPLEDEETTNNMFLTYNRFLYNIEKKRISPTKLFKIISKVQFMIVFMDNSKFSARELYQSLNNKDDLSQINLITSFISQNCELSMGLWQKAMNTYKNLGLQGFFKDFMRDFLTIQNNGEFPSESGLYNGFKNYFYKISQYQPTQKTIDNIYKYSQFYLKILQSDFEDFEIKKQFITINENGGQDAYPYLMEVLDDVENGHIDKGVFVDILTMINSFILNRESMGNSAISFATLSGELNKMIALKDYDTSGIDDTFDSVIEENKITINELNKLSSFDV